MNSDHVFTADNGSSFVSLDRTTGQTISANASTQPMTVTFNAATSSYTVTTTGRSQVFAPADKAAPNALSVDFQKTNGVVTDYLTLVKSLYANGVANRYVQMGFWRRDFFSGSRQDTSLDGFTFGFETPASAVPRTGSAGFNVDAFGLRTNPGFEPATFDGSGTFDIDFLTGVYSVAVPLSETGLVSGIQQSGGIDLTGAGRLSTVSGGFSGNLVYTGYRGSVSGTMSGRFYGPGGEEIGARFNGQTFNGSTFSGALTGQLNPNAAPLNRTLTNIVSDQSLNTFEAHLDVVNPNSSVISPQQSSIAGQLQLKANGQFFYDPGMLMVSGTFTAANVVASADPNFTAYRQTLAGHDVSLKLYKPGGANTELPLTYLSFGVWNAAGLPGPRDVSVYFAYGLQTKPGLLARTGTAHYAGVAYGHGANRLGGELYDVRGSSSFDVDFARQTVAGALVLNGTRTNGPGFIAFGQYDFSGPFGSDGVTLPLMRAGANVNGNIGVRFFGPDGEEIGGPFVLTLPGNVPGAETTIAGIAVAKR